MIIALDVIEGKIGMLELSPPVTFEPVGPVTTVFFDDKNQQARATQGKKKNITQLFRCSQFGRVVQQGSPSSHLMGTPQ